MSGSDPSEAEGAVKSAQDIMYKWLIVGRDDNIRAAMQGLLDVITALTEGEVLAPKLDPEPWREDDGTRWSRDGMGGLDHVFDPRPVFSQNPADYGIEAPHE